MQPAYYHGTSPKAARAIARQGFRVWFDDPEIGRYASGGNLGCGVYLSAEWRVALWFGPTLLRVALRAGTKLLDASIPPDPGALDSVRREFGHEVLTHAPWKALPANKRLALPELIALVRSHYRAAWENTSTDGPASPRKRRLVALDELRRYRSMLVRYGFHGYGNPSDDNGIVIFAEDRIASAKPIAAIPSDAYERSWKTGFESYPNIEDIEKKFPFRETP